MKVLIVEDEPMAQASLCRMLLKNYSDIEIAGMTGSVAETVEWLGAGNSPEVIFMDVELTDGDCFEIFRKAQVNAKVVMTTAYDNYAVRAFEVNSIDYLLKPIDKSALDRAVDRCRKAVANTDVNAIARAFGNEAPAADIPGASRPASHEYKQRFMVRLNDKILPIPVNEIAYFISEDKVTWLYTSEGSKYVMDSSLDVLSSQLDPSHFFRISRACIISSSAVLSIIKLQGGRLKINTRPRYVSDVLVSRSRSDEFLSWLERI